MHAKTTEINETVWKSFGFTAWSTTHFKVFANGGDPSSRLFTSAVVSILPEGVKKNVLGLLVRRPLEPVYIVCSIWRCTIKKIGMGGIAQELGVLLQQGDSDVEMIEQE